MPLPRRLALLGAVPVLLAGCGAGPGTAPPTGVDELVVPTPSPDPQDFVAGIDNPWLPLQPGNVWVYESSGGEPATVTVSVTTRTREVAGISATVVTDVVRGRGGDVVEQTEDWYAQDRDGNVWHLGEDAREPDDPGRPEPSGSWQAGVDGARAGLAMPAEPRIGDGYQEEDAPGTAEDRAQVLALDGEADVPFGSFSGLLVTEGTTPLTPGVVERTSYARGVGRVLEETVSGGSERLELVSFAPG